jgi:hypothetical protein
MNFNAGDFLGRLRKPEVEACEPIAALRLRQVQRIREIHALERPTERGGGQRGILHRHTRQPGESGERFTKSEGARVDAPVIKYNRSAVLLAGQSGWDRIFSLLKNSYCIFASK